MKVVIPILSALGLAIANAPVGFAQTAVIDSANLQQNSQTASQAASAVQQLQASLAQLQQTYSMFTAMTNTEVMAPGLDDPAVENPMPPAGGMATLMSGQGSASNDTGGYFSQSHIYTPHDGSVASNQLNANALAIANIQNLATTNLAAIEQRIAQLPLLEADLAAASSITQLVAIDAKIALQSQFVEAQEAQASNLQVLAFEQVQSHSQQIEEEHAQETTLLAAQYGAAASK